MRSFVRAALIGTAAVMSLGMAAGAYAEEKIVVTVYSGIWGTSQGACVLEPFSKATGITAVPEPAISSVAITKLMQQRANPEIDVVWLDGGPSEQAWSEGIIEAIDPAAVPNIKVLSDKGIYKTKDGQIYGLGTGYYATGMFYNTKEVKDAPTSWLDLWKPEYAGRAIFMSPALANFVPTFLHINQILGGTPSNIDPAIEKFKTLKVSSYYDSTGTIQASIQSSEAIIGAHYINAIWAVNDQNVPVIPVVPKEGVPAGDIRVHLVKGSKHKEAALKFINYATSEEALNCLAERLYIGPPLKSPKLSDKAKQRMPWGPTGSIDNLVVPDWNVVNAERAKIIEQWNRRVVGK
ncbi:MAG TPA: ABC transporter substrate-binding protein [Stellaceae bacterium]|nr:ABC transporter substrate-binding protein [Stellaceae bacterium]